VTGLLITSRSVQGKLAEWVCRQHPYRSVAGVDAVNVALDRHFDEEWTEGCASLPMRRFETWAALQTWLHEKLDGHPQMTAWNTPKIDTGAEIMFSSRYDTPKQEYDFIDLDALLRNVALETWREAERDDAFSKKFDAQMAAGGPVTV